MLQVKKICSHCGTSFEVDIDVKDKDSLCPASNCYGKKTKCIKCDDFAKFTQPDKEVILLMYATSIFILNTWDRIFNEAV